MATSADLPAIAFHEAGHVVAAWHFGLKLCSITFEGGGKCEHRAFTHEFDLSDRMPVMDVSDRVKAITYLAGPLAERIHHARGPASIIGAWRDIQEIKTLAWAVEPQDPRGFCRTLSRQTRALVTLRRQHILSLAGALMECAEIRDGEPRGRMEGEEAQALLDRCGPSACPPEGQDRVTSVLAALDDLSGERAA